MMTMLIYLVMLAQENQLLQKIDASGRCAGVLDEGNLIAPGPPPLLSFRFYEGKMRHQFGNSDLMMDDAGH